MKKNLVRLAFSLALLMTAAAQAQNTHLKADVPFSFTAQGVTLPAGKYEVESAGNDHVLVVRNLDSKAAAFVLTGSCQSMQAAASTKLVFHRYGHRYFLSEVWVQGNTIGHRMPAGSREVELAKDYSMDEVVLAANGN